MLKKKTVLINKLPSDTATKEFIIKDLGLQDSFLFTEIEKFYPYPSILIANITDSNNDYSVVRTLAQQIRQTQNIKEKFVIISFQLNTDELKYFSRTMEKYLSTLVYQLLLLEVSLEGLALAFSFHGSISEDKLELLSFLFFRTLLRSIPPAFGHILVDCCNVLSMGSIIQSVYHIDFDKPWNVSLFVNIDASDAIHLQSGKKSFFKSVIECFKGNYTHSEEEDGSSSNEEPMLIVGEL